MKGSDPFAAAVELASELQAVGNAVGKTLDDDLSSAEHQWLKDFAVEVDKYIKNHPTGDPDPSTPSQSPATKKTEKKATDKTVKSKDIFPEYQPAGASLAFAYTPAPGELSSRPAPHVPFSLAEGAGRESYREWRIQAESFANTQSKLRIIEDSVRDQLVASLGSSIKAAMVAQFSSNLKTATVHEIIGFLDSRFAYLAIPKMFASSTSSTHAADPLPRL